MTAELVVIVVEPQTPGNIGSICRAMTNMGLRELILVNPCDYLVDDTYRFGWGARELIEGIHCCTTLEEALYRVDVSIGTTNRRRENQAPLFPARDMIAHVKSLGEIRVGLVMGRENNGLTNEELLSCHFQSTIPAAVAYPALNLSQAVMIYAYEWWMGKEREPRSVIEPARHDEIERLYGMMGDAIETLPFKTRNGTTAFVNLFRRIFGRTILESRDVRLLFKLFGLIHHRGGGGDSARGDLRSPPPEKSGPFKHT